MEQNELQDGITVFRDIETELGRLESVYLGPGGVFVCAEALSDPDRSCILLKDALRVSRLRLYSAEHGIYDMLSGRYEHGVSKAQIEALALSFVACRDGLYFYTPEDISAMCRRLVRADAYARGWYRSPDGTLYRRRGDVFREVSDKDSECLYYLALFGGALGLHRFYLGRYFSGLLYLFTGGLLCMGWGIDLVFLLLGSQQDNRKRILPAPKNRLRKLLLLPLGFLISGSTMVILLSLYRSILSGNITPFPQILLSVFDVF